DRGAGGAACRTDDLLFAPICRGRGADELRQQHHGCLSPGRALCRSDSQRRQAHRPAGCASDESRAGPQSQDGESARHHLSALATRPRRRGDRVNRREFVTLLGGTAAWPLAARAQQALTPVIGVLSPTSPAAAVRNIAALRQGLRELGYIDGRNVAIEYRFAERVTERL